MVRTNPPQSYWAIAFLALIWNLLGVSYMVFRLTATSEFLTKLEPILSKFYNNELMGYLFYGITCNSTIPAITGLLGSIGLIMRRRWAVPLFLVSPIFIILGLTYIIIAFNPVETLGIVSIVIPMVIIMIGVFFWYYAKKSKRKGWII